jgi:hypothetical protein
VMVTMKTRIAIRAGVKGEEAMFALHRFDRASHYRVRLKDMQYSTT